MGRGQASLCGVHAVEECEDLLDRDEMAAGVEHVPAPAVERRVGDAQRDEVDDVIAERGVVPQQLPVDPWLAPFIHTLEAVSRPFFPRCFLVACALLFKSLYMASVPW